MKRVNNNSSVDLLPKGLEGSVKFNPTLQKEMGEEREIKKINDYPETSGATSTCVYQGHLREEEVGQAVR